MDHSQTNIIEPKIQLEGLTLPKITQLDDIGRYLQYSYPNGLKVEVKYVRKSYSGPSSEDIVKVRMTYPDSTVIQSTHNRTNRCLSDYRDGFNKYPPGYLDSQVLQGILLDIGTGRGHFVEDLREEGIDAYGLDVWLDTTQLGTGHYIPGLAHKTGLPDNLASTITANCILHYSMTDDYRREVLCELVRIVNFGGKILIHPVSEKDQEKYLSLLEDLPVECITDNIPEFKLLEIRKT